MDANPKFLDLVNSGIISENFLHRFPDVKSIESEIYSVLSSIDEKYAHCDIQRWKDLLVACFVLFDDQKGRPVPLLCVIGAALVRLKQSQITTNPEKNDRSELSCEEVTSLCYLSTKGPVNSISSLVTSSLTERYKSLTEHHHIIVLKKPLTHNELNSLIPCLGKNSELFITNWYRVKGNIEEKNINLLIGYFRKKFPDVRLFYQVVFGIINVKVIIHFDSSKIRAHLEKTLYKVNMPGFDVHLIPAPNSFCCQSEEYDLCQHDSCKIYDLNRVLF